MGERTRLLSAGSVSSVTLLYPQDEELPAPRPLPALLQFWRTGAVVVLPCLLAPLLSAGLEARCGFVILLMSGYWVLEVVPLPVTALLPVVLLPLLGVMDTGAVCQQYLKESNMMFIGGLITAIAVESSGLHQAIALKALLLLGTSPRLLMLGFILPTAFLSMWISNTATTAMMVPMVEAVLAELGDKGGVSSRIRVMVYLSVAYAANTGGTGTLTGTGPNLVLKGMLGTLFSGRTPVNFASWMGYAVPCMLVNLLICWAWLQLYFLGWRGGVGEEVGGGVRVKKLLKERYRQLGGWTFRQVAVLLLFLLLVLLWFTRDPQFITGWGELFTRPGNPPCRTAHQLVDDASPALLVVFLLFVLPSELNFWPWVPLASSRSSPSLLDWRTVHDRFPWGVALLFGGGFALAEAASQSGLSSWVGEQLTVLAALPPWALVLAVCVLTATVTEVTNDDQDNT